jgi:hypothetical protein
MSQFKKPTALGAPYSVYVKSVRLTLEEKAVDYDLMPDDIFVAGGVSSRGDRNVSGCFGIQGPSPFARRGPCRLGKAERSPSPGLLWTGDHA